MPSTVEDLDAIAADLDQLALADTTTAAASLLIEKIAARVRAVGDDVTVVGGPRTARDTWDLDVASAPADATPSVKFKANDHAPHRAVRVFVGAVDRTHALVGTLRCTDADLAALRGIPEGRTVVSWERTP